MKTPRSKSSGGTISHLWRIFCLATLCLLLPSTALAWPGKVVGVSDGDTITVLRDERQPVKIRLYGIDCPERKQPWGNRATQATSRLCYGKGVDIQEFGHDRYGRTVAVVILPDSSSLQERLVAEGLAWVWPRYCKQAFCLDWEKLEDTARREKRGLWRDEAPVPPWEWRLNR